ncbi:MAG: LysR substrate-binding domain-containing protein [Planctomycetota bacterium]
MNVRDLEYALALRAAGQFGKAAQRCGVSQPTLSTQIAKLESSLGVRLFERGPRGVTATPVGERVLTKARGVLEAMEQLRAEACESAAVWRGPLRLGVIATAGPYVMPHVLPTITRHQPAAQLLIREGLTDSLLERLHHLELDAAIVSPPIASAGLVVEALGVEPFVLAVPRRHALAKRDAVRLADLADESLLLLEEGHCLRAQAIGFCPTDGRPQESFQASSLESLRQMVAAGIGPTLLPKLATVHNAPRLRGLVLRPFREPTPTRTLSLVWRRSSPRGPALRALAEAIREPLGKALAKA